MAVGCAQKAATFVEGGDHVQVAVAVKVHVKGHVKVHVNLSHLPLTMLG